MEDLWRRNGTEEAVAAAHFGWRPHLQSMAYWSQAYSNPAATAYTHDMTQGGSQVAQREQ